MKEASLGVERGVRKDQDGGDEGREAGRQAGEIWSDNVKGTASIRLELILWIAPIYFLRREYE
jgi:hypothetical protein